MCLNLCSIYIASIVCVLLLLVIDSWAGVHGKGGLPAWLVLLLGGRGGRAAATLTPYPLTCR
jgi:hypothetical protein